MSDARDPDNFCYRHPNRQSFVLCQRCGRTVCSDCQTQAAVGVHCPECVNEARSRMPKRKPAIVTAFRRSSNKPVVTYSLLAVMVLTFLVQAVSGGLNGPLSSPIAALSVFFPAYAAEQPWRMLTAIFVHVGLLQVLFNLLSVWLLGRILEPSVGRLRFLALFLLSGLGGSLGASLFNGQLYFGIGAAITGLIIGIFVIQYRQGVNNWGILVLVGLNLVFSIVVSSVLLPGIVGGILVGAAVALILSQTRGVRQVRLQAGLLAALAIVIVVLTVARVSLF